MASMLYLQDAVVQYDTADLFHFTGLPDFGARLCGRLGFRSLLTGCLGDQCLLAWGLGIQLVLAGRLVQCLLTGRFHLQHLLTGCPYVLSTNHTASLANWQ